MIYREELLPGIFEGDRYVTELKVHVTQYRL